MEKEKEIPRRPQSSDATRSPLHDQFDAAKPIYADNKTAIAALSAQLEQLAVSLGTTVEAVLREAHTTTSFEPHYRTALNLERQINLLKS